MGIDFSHGEAQWSYSGFAQFRTAIATREGIDLNQMYGYGGERSWDTITSPLRPLLDHSDCDGNLSPADCTAIASHLHTVVEELWPATLQQDDDPIGTYHRQAGLALADGMEQAAEADEPLEFM
ncbi:hypothetical protein [Streptomyces sp. ISL-94]|uniref:hypothetical protein n=1 Tax=Streptomyces sp. ISL-94 TaxID=2819190 RepID=UPI001BE61407|nr:hypothetical protein [Streptomyces sp. ISL-94]MBT2477608.1 hypothetical protein [Streptomyces sp. ISL-94]